MMAATLAFIAGAGMAAAVSSAPRSAEVGPAAPPRVVTTLTFASGTLALGEQLAGHVEVVVSPPDLPRDAHLVFVLDQSASMGGDKITALKQSMNDFIDFLERSDWGDSKIGIVAFNTGATITCPLTDSVAQLRACVARLAASLGTSIDAGIRQGLRALQAGRLPQPPAIPEEMMVLTDGANNGGCAPVLQRAQEAKADSVRMTAVCLGVDCDAACLRQVATSPRYFYQVDATAAMTQVFMRVAKSILRWPMATMLRVRVDLPPHLALVPGSMARPGSAMGNALSWDVDELVDGSFQADFLVVGVATGAAAAHASASMLLTDIGQRTFHAASQPVVIDSVPPCDCPPALSVFEPQQVRSAAPPTVLNGDDGCVPTTLLEPVGWRQYTLCDRQPTVATFTVSGSGTIAIYQPRYVPDSPCSFAVGAGPTGRPLTVTISPGPFELAVFGAEDPRDPARTLTMTLPCSPVLPTPTATQPGPTSTDSPTATPTPPDTPTPRRPQPLYLPLTLAEACGLPRALDVVFVLDTSNSMLESIPGGGTKLAAAQQAVRSALGTLNLAQGRAALVAFHHAPTIAAPLTQDRGKLLAALDQLTTADGTAIDRALVAADGLLRLTSGDEPRPPVDGNRNRIVILLTDGRGDPDSEPAVLAAAARLRQLADVFAVGLGSEVDARLLRQVAGELPGRPGRYLAAVTRSGLAATFSDLTWHLACTPRWLADPWR
jgi:Mg-chelatase subunit ChlD